jgi:hypothetical protein
MIFDFPNEVLTHISGYYGSLMYMGPSTIRSLTFHTTKRTYGPFGDEYGTYFTTKLKEGKVVGIHGRKGLFLDALGVHVIEGKVIVSVPTSPSMEIIPREPSITETKSAQWPAKLVLSKSAPLEEVFLKSFYDNARIYHLFGVTHGVSVIVYIIGCDGLSF